MFHKCFKNFSKIKKMFREYCARNYVSDEVNFSSSDWENIIADIELPSPRTKKKSKFFGCIPPESGSTIFQAWWWDVYNPQLDFTKRSRTKIQDKMHIMTVRFLLHINYTPALFYSSVSKFQQKRPENKAGRVYDIMPISKPKTLTIVL